MSWWIVLGSFLGAVVGAGIPAVVAWRGQNQDARTEWRQRLDQAVAAVTSQDPTSRNIGKELLADLIDSDLGSDRDRDLARRIARLEMGSSAVDSSGATGDTGSHQPKEDT